MEREEKIKAVKNKDKRYDGQFFVAVKSTKIVCCYFPVVVDHTQPTLDCQIVKTENIGTLQAEQQNHFRCPYAYEAQATIWQRMKDSFGDVNAAAIAEASISELQSFGMTFRKAEYIQDL